MAKKKLLRLTWLDEAGEAYHTADLAPDVARELLKRAGMFRIDFPGVSRDHPLRHVTRAAVERSPRGLIAKPMPTSNRDGLKRVLITLPEDNPEQTPNEVK